MRLPNSYILLLLKYILGKSPYLTLPPLQKLWMTVKSDVKMGNVASKAKIHTKQVQACILKKTAHMYARPHTCTHRIIPSKITFLQLSIYINSWELTTVLGVYRRIALLSSQFQVLFSCTNLTLLTWKINLPPSFFKWILTNADSDPQVVGSEQLEPKSADEMSSHY